MGNRLSLFRRNRTSNSKLGQRTPCPCCGISFPSSTTYLAFNSHIDSCLLQQEANINNNIPNENAQTENVRSNNHVRNNVVREENLIRAETTSVMHKPWKRQIVEDPNLEYYWQKVPVKLAPNDLSKKESGTNKEITIDSSSSKDDQKYKWEKRSYKKESLNSESLRKLAPADVMKLSFEKKQIWLRQKCDAKRISWMQGADWIKINPDNILMNSLFEIQKCNMHKEVKIQIIGDKVNDAGGLLREWIHLCMKEIFRSDTGMFLKAETQDVSYKINKDADRVDHVLDCFRLLGKIIGKAIFERITMNASFDRSIINYILGKPTQLSDIYFYDKQLYKSWVSLRDTTLGEDDFIDVFAVYKKQPDGSMKTIELIPNGEEVIVNNSNKLDYIEKQIKYACVDSVKEFLDVMCNEIYKIVPAAELSVFESHELEMILIGVPFIDVEEWKTHTEYSGYTANATNVKRFWQILEEFSQEELSKFLQYCTGSARTPVEGFKKLESNRGNYSKFHVKQIPYTKANPYPKAHTCFNRLELPDYPNLETMRMYMKAIVQNDLDGVYGLD